MAALAEVQTDLQAATTMLAAARYTEKVMVVAAILVVAHCFGSSAVAAPLQYIADASRMVFSQHV